MIRLNHSMRKLKLNRQNMILTLSHNAMTTIIIINEQHEHCEWHDLSIYIYIYIRNIIYVIRTLVISLYLQAGT